MDAVQLEQLLLKQNEAFAVMMEKVVSALKAPAGAGGPAAQVTPGVATVDAGPREKIPGAKKILDFRDYANIETFAGGEEGWSHWSWLLKVATSTSSYQLHDVLKAAETRPGMSTEEIIAEIDPMDTVLNMPDCKRGSAELYSILARYTTGEAAALVKSTKNERDGVEAYGRMHESFNKKTMGRMFRIQRECMYPKEVKDLSKLKGAILEWEQKWKKMMEEINDDKVKIPELWKMSALMEMIPKDLKEHMLLKMDEVGDKYEVLREKIIVYANNKVETGRKAGPVPMEVDEVLQESWSEEWNEELEVDAVNEWTQCHNCHGYGHMARDCPSKGKGKGKKGKGNGSNYDGGKNGYYNGNWKGGQPWGKGNGDKGKGKGKDGKKGGYQGTCYKCGKVGHKAAECRSGTYAVEEESNIEEVQEENCGGVWVVGEVNDEMAVQDSSTVADIRESGCRSSGCTGVASPPGLHQGHPRVLGDWISKAFRREHRDARKARLQARGKVPGTFEGKNRFDLLKEEDEPEVIAEVHEVVGEVVEVTVDSGAAKSVWPVRKSGVERRKMKKQVKLAAANGSPIRVDGEAILHFRQEGHDCSMKFLDADVRRPLAAVGAIVDEGNMVVFRASGAFIQNEATGKRIPMIRKNGVYVIELDGFKKQKEKAQGKGDAMETGNVGEIDGDDGFVFWTGSTGFRRQA